MSLRSVPEAGVEPANTRVSSQSLCASVGVPVVLVKFLSEVVPDGLEPSFPGCKPAVVAVGPRDCNSLWFISPQWTHPELHRDLRHATPASSCWTMSPSCGAEAVRLELTSRRSRHLVSRQAPHQPDDFRPDCRIFIQAAEVGIEPTASWFRARRYNSNVPRSSACSSGFSPRRTTTVTRASGGRNRTRRCWCFKGITFLPRTTGRRHSKSALRESNPPRQVGSLEPLPLGQGHIT